MANLLEKLLSAIPEAGYDLIARIIPGGLVIAAAISKNKFPLPGVTTDGSLTITEVIVFLSLAYAAGLAISSIAHGFVFLTWYVVFPILKAGKVDERLMHAIKLARQDNNQNLELNWNPLLADGLLSHVHDIIKSRGVEERPVVMKLLAEVLLLYSLTIGMAAVLLITQEFPKYWLIPAAFLLAGIFRSVRIWTRHISILDALVMPLPTGEVKSED